VEHRFLGEGIESFGERGAPEQVGGVIGMITGLDGETDDLATVEVEDQGERTPVR